MANFKCKICGGSLEIDSAQSVATCEYCGTRQTLPKLDDERRANLYDRANHFRRNNDFDKAMGIYEQILNEDGTDAEAYWSLVLCCYGIEYVEDPASHKRIPTVNRAQFTSVFDDDNYKSALEYADSYQRRIYEDEAKAINEIQKDILAISQKEEPFDIFICYKETDNNGRRTPDSVLAQELYYQLVQEGFKVFFSRITLEDKLGTAYEPYIFAALNSAKVMVALGTKPEYFNAVWVKNEWRRYLALIKQGQKKMFIPAYKDMDPYDLPEEFSHLQAQDMSKLGFMQDLIRGIKKIVETDEPKTTVVKETIVTQSAPTANVNIAPLLKRAFMFLEDGDWSKADDFCEQVLNQDPENAQAYLGKLMVELHIKVRSDLANCKEPFENNKSYIKVIRFSDDILKAEIIGYCNEAKNKYAEEQYDKALKELNNATSISELKAISKKLTAISYYKGSKELIKECDKKIRELSEKFLNILKKHQVSSTQKNIFAGNPSLGIKSDGTVVAAGDNEYGECNVSDWCDIVAIATDCGRTVGLKLDGTVVATGDNEYGQCNVSNWTDIVAISTGWSHTVGLKSDGTVVAVGDNECGECNVSDWADIVAIACGDNNTVGLKSDGTVVATGDNEFGQCNVSNWNNIFSIFVHDSYTVGLKLDGTVVAVGEIEGKKYNLSGWSDIVAVSISQFNIAGLKSDGTAVAVGWNEYGQCNVSGWSDIVAISATGLETFGLKSDGTVVAVGNISDFRFIDDLSDIVSISSGGSKILGLKSDGTVVTDNRDVLKQIDRWSDIALPIFADSKAEYEEKRRQHIKSAVEENRKLRTYNNALSYMSRNTITDYKEAIGSFETIIGYRDSDELLNTCHSKIEALELQAEAERVEKEHQAEIARIETAKREKKEKIISSIVISILLILIVFGVIYGTFIMPAIRYNEATILMEAGKYSEAILAFEALEGYKGSATKIAECNTAILDSKYNDAIALMDAGDVIEAYEALIALNGYKDSAGKASSIFAKYNVEKLKVAKAGDYVFFGAYEQDNNTSNGKEVVEWLVLDVKDGKVFVISKYALDCQQYNTDNRNVTWETCTLRKWLNDDFINAAFSADEKAMIPTVTVSVDKNPNYSTEPGNATQDQVFLLSITEANKYFGSVSTRQCKPTDYAVANGAYVDSPTGNCLWWLRAPGSRSWFAAPVIYNGDINTGGAGGVTQNDTAVRPAMWITIPD